MISLGAFLAILFIYFAPGLLIVLNKPYTVSVKIIATVVYSFLISWCVFYVGFFLNISVFPMYILSTALVGIVTIQVFNKLRLEEVNFSLASSKLPTIIITGIVYTTIIFSTGALDSVLSNFGSIYTKWDAVVSWNRWAIELSKGEYRPINAAYPILFPALWSIIYKFQQTPDIWFFAKGSLSILPIVFIIYAFAATIESKRIFFPLLTAFVGISFLGKEEMVNGYMDTQVALLAVLSMALYWQSENQDRSNADHLVNLSLITAALSSITKQPGIIVLMLVLAMVLYRDRIAILKNRARLFYALVSILLPVSFLFIFAYHRDIFLYAGNIDDLITLTEKKSAGSILLNAFNLIESYIGLPMIIILLAGSFLNLVRFDIRKLDTGIFTLVGGVFGLLLWANLFSYSIRNAIWIIALFCVSASSGYTLLFEIISSKFGRKFSWHWIQESAGLSIFKSKIKPIFLVYAIALLPLMVVPLALMNSDSQLVASQHKNQLKVGFEEINKFILNNKDKIPEDAHVISQYQLYKFLPGAPGIYAWNSMTSGDSLARSAYFKNGTFVLVAAWEKEVLNFSDRLVDTNQAELIDSYEGWRLLRLKNLNKT